MTTRQAASEPLLWLQLLGAAVLPLEALLVMLLLAGSDPGPLPGLERLFCWSIGSLAPTLLLWRRPADVWSLLLVQTPARGRRELQRRLSTLQENRPLKLALAAGSALLLILLWRLDRAAALASGLAPLPDSPRLVGLLLSALVLALMLWQWQQLLQSIWLLSRSPEAVAATEPMAPTDLAERRLSLGLPLLLPQPLAAKPVEDPAAQLEPDPDLSKEQQKSSGPDREPEFGQGPARESADLTPAEKVTPAKTEDESLAIVEVEAEIVDPEAADQETLSQVEGSDQAASAILDPVAVEPQERSEQPDGPELNQPVG